MYSMVFTLIASFLSLCCLSLWRKAAMLEDLSLVKQAYEQEYYLLRDLCAYARAYHTTLSEQTEPYACTLSQFPVGLEGSPYSAHIAFVPAQTASASQVTLHVTLFKAGASVASKTVLLSQNKQEHP